MTLTRQQQDELLAAARPLIQWINEHCHPHVTVTVDCDSATLAEDVAKVKTDEFIKD